MNAVAVRFEKVTFAYGDVPVLSDASFHIHGGEFAAIIGPNGSGKTTLIRLILGLARPSPGRVEVLGRSPESARDSIGYVPQHMTFDPAFPISVEEVVRMGTLRGGMGRYDFSRREAIDRALAATDVTELRMRPYSALSGGQRRRVLVARALAGEPELLILDEPTANMDVESEGRLYRALGELKGRSTIIVVTHDAGFVSALTDSVFCVGERGHGVVRHPAVQAEYVPLEIFGGEALAVLHDTELPEDGCCGTELP